MSINTYKIPISIDESVILNYTGGPIKSAALYINSCVMGRITPAFDAETGPLDFFGGSPLHAALLRNCRVYCEIKMEGSRIPSISMLVMPKKITWDNVKSPYEEKVSIGGKERTIIYTPQVVGFQSP
jgi:hypothetical protein